MLKKLELQDVKTHKVTKLEFSKGVNVITGDSGSGKTNILLALNWLVNNRPLGNSIIKRGQDRCESTLTVDRNGEEYSIIRKRSRNENENTYTLEKGGVVVGKPLESFGTSPPDVVSDILNLSDINIQKQLKPYFLVLDPPGQVATYVRSLIKLDEIDKVVKLLSKKVNAEKAELANFQRDLKLVEDELKELSKIDLRRFEQKILEAKKTIESIREIEKKKSELESILRELKALEAKRITLPDDIDQRVIEVDANCNSFIKLSEKISELKSLTEELKDVEDCKIVLPDDIDQRLSKVDIDCNLFVKLSEKIDELKLLTKGLKDIANCKIILPENIDDILSAVETAEEKYNDTYSKIEMLLDITEQIQGIQFKIENIDEQLVELHEEESNLIGQLETCPSCGTELTVESRECLLRRSEGE